MLALVISNMRGSTWSLSGAQSWWLTPLRINTMERLVRLLSKFEVDGVGFMLIVASHRYFTFLLWMCKYVVNSISLLIHEICTSKVPICRRVRKLVQWRY
jgi:hypothetical protein